MIVYLILLFLIILFGLTIDIKKDKNKKFYLALVFILFSFVAALRNFTVGIDTLQFYNAFTRISGCTPADFDIFRYEVGFTYFCWILSKVIDHPQILIFVTSFFINYVIIRFIYKNSENILASVLVYLLMNFFFSYMNVMRQAIAICFVLLGYEYLKKGKNLNYIIFCILGSLFHQSALLAILMVFINKVKFNIKTLIVLLILMILGFYNGVQLFDLLARYSPRLEAYVGGKYYVSNYFGSLLDALLYLMIYIYGIFILRDYDKRILEKKGWTENNLIGIMGVACFFQILVIKISLFNRFSPYFSIFMIIWLPNFIEKIKKPKNKVLVYGGIFFILFVYWMVIMMFRPEWYGVVPYSTFF